MARGTLRDTVGGELRFMDISVTGLTVGPDPGELDQSPVTGVCHVRVALVAGDLYMHSFEREVAL